MAAFALPRPSASEAQRGGSSASVSARCLCCCLYVVSLGSGKLLQGLLGWEDFKEDSSTCQPGMLRRHCPQPLLTSGLLAAGSLTPQLTFVASFNSPWDGDSEGARSLMAPMSSVGGWSRAQRLGTSALMNLIASRA